MSKILVKRAVIVEYVIDANDGAYFGMDRDEILQSEKEMEVGIYLEEVDAIVSKDDNGVKKLESIVGVEFIDE